MRFYSFVIGLYLSDKQKGIQTQHVTAEMSIEPNAGHWYADWAKNHKTTIVLDAMTCGGVKRAYSSLLNFAMRLPFYAEFNDCPVSIFHEDEESLGGIPTACGIIVPDFIYNAKLDIDTDDFVVYNENGEIVRVLEDVEADFAKFLRSHRLA
jgi:hypothetical protein